MKVYYQFSLSWALKNQKQACCPVARKDMATECGSSCPGNVCHHAVRWGTELGLMSPGTTEEGEPENHQAWGCAHTSRFSKHHQSPSGLMIAQSTNIEQWITNLGYNGCVPPQGPSNTANCVQHTFSHRGPPTELNPVQTPE